MVIIQYCVEVFHYFVIKDMLKYYFCIFHIQRIERVHISKEGM